MHNQSIGVLDSGIGGLTIWQEIVRQLPHESTIYLADSRNCPYGSKTPEEIYSLAKKLVSFLVQQEVKLIVLACNTITVSCLDKLRQDFLNVPIVGAVPVVKTAVEKTRNKKIGILSTTRTAQSQYQKALIGQFAKDVTVINLGTDKLVPFVERGELQGEALQATLQEVLQPFQAADIDTLVLGCSHFPFLKTEMQKILGPDVLILDSGAAIARQVKRVLEHNKTFSGQKSAAYIAFTTGEKSILTKLLDAVVDQNMPKVEEITFA